MIIKIKKIIDENIKHKYLKHIFGDIGKVVEYPDKIVCFADQKAIDNLKISTDIIIIDINNENSNNLFKTNKPIYYIFDGINFTTRILINSMDSNVIFKNCVFSRKINICDVNSVIFDDNTYIINDNTYPYSGCYIDITPNHSIKKICFKNEKYIDTSWRSNKNYNPKNGQYFISDVLEIIGSKFTSDDASSLYINANKTIISNSLIYVKELYINSKSIDILNSNISSIDGIIIQNEDRDLNCELYSDFIVYNGVISNSNNCIRSNKDLKKSRVQLINQLYSLINYCNQLNDIRLEHYKNKLNNNKINKILEKNNGH